MRWEWRKHKKSPPCSEHDGDRHLNHNEKALICILQHTGPESKEDLMPRVTPLTEEARYKESFNYVLDRKRAEGRYKDWACLAEALGIPRDTLYTWRRDPGGIPSRKLRQIYKKLRYTPEEIAESMGLERRSA